MAINPLPPTEKETYWHKKGILSASIHDEVVMMSIEMGQYYNLNTVAGRIWHLLETPQNLDQITAALAEIYDAPTDTIRAEVAAFLARLKQEGLLESAADSAP